MNGRAVERENPTYALETVSAVYADACSKFGDDWDDVDNYTLPNNSMSPYELLDWIGSGKYGEVFTAYRLPEREIVAIKVLKPVRMQKYIREAKILSCVRGGPNIVNLYDVVRHPRSGQYSFVFEHVKETDSDELFASMDPKECAFYLFQLMRALQFAHSRGIMHRDVKPLNVLYDRKTMKLRLIDWGLAEFYHPKERYHIHVASRHYKPIELLLDYQCYDYSLDIWSFGVTMAGIVFGKLPFFRGSSDVDMVAKIAGVLGTDALDEYCKKYGIPLPKEVAKALNSAPKEARPWKSFVTEENSHLATDLALDLIDKCVRYDHTERITADDALKHPYFDEVREMTSL